MSIVNWLVFVTVLLAVPAAVLFGFILSLRQERQKQKAIDSFERFKRALLNRGIRGFDEEWLSSRFGSKRFRGRTLRCLKMALCIVKSGLFTERHASARLILEEALFRDSVVLSRFTENFDVLSNACALDSWKLLYKGLFNLFTLPVYGSRTREFDISRSIPRNTSHDQELLSDLEVCGSHLRAVDLAAAWSVMSKWLEPKIRRQLSGDFQLPLTLVGEYVDVIYEPVRMPLKPRELRKAAVRLGRSTQRFAKYLRRGNRKKLLKEIVRLLAELEKAQN